MWKHIVPLGGVWWPFLAFIRSPPIVCFRRSTVKSNFHIPTLIAWTILTKSLLKRQLQVASCALFTKWLQSFPSPTSEVWRQSLEPAGWAGVKTIIILVPNSFFFSTNEQKTFPRHSGTISKAAKKSGTNTSAWAFSMPLTFRLYIILHNISDWVYRFS